MAGQSDSHVVTVSGTIGTVGPSLSALRELLANAKQAVLLLLCMDENVAVSREYFDYAKLVKVQKMRRLL